MLDTETLSRFCREHNISYRQNLPMAEYTTFHVGGKADFAALPSSEEELTLIVGELRRMGEQPVFVGKGSNLLISDEGIRGAVVFTWASRTSPSPARPSSPGRGRAFPPSAGRPRPRACRGWNSLSVSPSQPDAG